MHRLGRALLLLTLLTLLVGCGGCGSDTVRSGATESASEAAGEDGWHQAVSLIDLLPRCDVNHRGLLFDMGTDAMLGRYSELLSAPKGIVASEHDGATWARIYDQKVSLDFYQPLVSPLFLTMRAIGRDASRATVSLDGIYIGTFHLKRDQVRIASTRITEQPVDAGLHRLDIRFRGNRKTDADPYAEVDWIRVGTPDELQRTYGAPTLDDVVSDSAELASVPHRALSMRAPGSVSCTLRVPLHARLRVAVGMHGDGAATAAVLAQRDGEDEVVLERVDVKGGEAATWTDIEVPLHDLANQIVTLELVAARTTGPGRLMFGDPAVFVPTQRRQKVADARAAVVVVLDGLERDELPPWRDTDTPHIPVLSHLARTLTVFHQHRAPSTSVSAVMASLITGLPPRAHALSDTGASLPSSVATLGRIASDASVRGAMFTNVPLTFEPFGFGCPAGSTRPGCQRQATTWDRFSEYPPNEGALASAPMVEAGAWLTDATDKPEEGRPMLAVIHTRGGHPPWEVTPEEASQLPPPDYAGGIGPRTAAQTLASYSGQQRRLGEADKERIRALFFAGLSRQDAALGELMKRLEDAGRWDSTLFIVTGDVASGRRTLFMDGLDLDEDLLTIPLYVHFPGGAHAASNVHEPTEVYDVTHTMLHALGVQPPKEMLGRDLSALADSAVHDLQLIRVAALDDRFSARWGDFVLGGKVGSNVELCDLRVDPTCAYDRSYLYPRVAQALFRNLVAFHQQRPRIPERQPLTLDSEQAGVLKIWGVY